MDLISSQWQIIEGKEKNNSAKHFVAMEDTCVGTDGGCHGSKTF